MVKAMKSQATQNTRKGLLNYFFCIFSVFRGFTRPPFHNMERELRIPPHSDHSFRSKLTTHSALN